MSVPFYPHGIAGGLCARCFEVLALSARGQTAAQQTTGALLTAGTDVPFNDVANIRVVTVTILSSVGTVSGMAPPGAQVTGLAQIEVLAHG